MFRFGFSVTIAMMVCVQLLLAQTPGVSVTAVRTGTPIIIDGVLSEPAWHQQGFSQFTQREPMEGGTPSQKTEIWIAYDDAALYVATQMHDTAPESIAVRLGRRDSWGDGDAIMFFVDPYHDKRSGFYFGLDAAGTLYDGILENDDWDDNSWDGIWEGKVTINTNGWCAEMRIPFSQLRFHEQVNNVWGINFRRDLTRTNERDYIVYTPKNGTGFVSRFVDLVGIQGIAPVRQFEVLPYLTTKAEFTRHAAGDPFNDGSTYGSRVGADFKLGLGSNLTLDGTVNPDFGQVEVDPAVVNLSDVETFFQEKRPFFIEGSSTLRFGQGGATNNWSFNWSTPTFFYSRRIGRTPQGGLPDADFAEIPSGTDIIGAAKLTGKVADNWNIGTIHAVTAREHANLEMAGTRFSSEVEPLTYYGIARALKEIDNGHYGIGMLATQTSRGFKDDRLRDQMNASGTLVGLDGWTFLDSSRTWVITAYGALSHVAGTPERMIALQRSSARYYQRPDAGHVSVDSSARSLTGYISRLFFTKSKGSSFLNGSLGLVSPGFEMNDLGFQSRTDVINSHVAGGYKWSEPTDVYRWLELGAALFRSYDFDGNITWQGIWNYFYMQFPNYYSAELKFAYNPETISIRRTRGGPSTITPPGREYFVGFESDVRRDFFVDLEWYSYWSDYTDNWELWTQFRWRPAPSVTLSLSPALSRNFQASQWVGAFTDPIATATYGRRYVFGEMQQTTFSTSIRLDWTFTPELSLQVYIQPLISAGAFTNFKSLARGRSYDFDIFGQANGSTLVERTDDNGNISYVADPDGAGPAAPIEFSNPDFNFKSLRGNAVLRWEFLPGSTMYFVWTQSRVDEEEIGNFRFGRSFQRLIKAEADNILMVKLAYWWSQ